MNKEQAMIKHIPEGSGFTQEITEVTKLLLETDPSKIRCLALVFVENAPSEENPEQCIIRHNIVGKPNQAAKMISSMYSALTRSLEAESSAAEIPPEKKQ